MIAGEGWLWVLMAEKGSAKLCLMVRAAGGRGHQTLQRALTGCCFPPNQVEQEAFLSCAGSLSGHPHKNGRISPGPLDWLLLTAVDATDDPWSLDCRPSNKTMSYNGKASREHKCPSEQQRIVQAASHLNLCR